MTEPIIAELSDLLWERVLARDPLAALHAGRPVESLPSGGPEAVGRALIQDIRDFSFGHNQVDDITLICFGPLAR